MTLDQVRFRCLAFSVIAYTAFSTLVTDNVVNTWAPAQRDATVRVVTTVMLRTVSLGLILTVLQFAGERLWARPILGVWAYASSRGTFGLVRIRFIDGSLNYSAQLFTSSQEVLTVLSEQIPVNPFAVVTSELSRFESSTGKFQTDYHVESTDTEHKSRKGLLALTPTGSGQMKGQWYSTVDGFVTKSGDLEFLRSKQFKRVFGVVAE